MNGSLSQAESQLRDLLHTKFGGSPVQTQILPFTDQVARTLAQERLLAALASCFGLLTLVLAAVGLYGLLAYTVVNSTREIGIRVALGAQRGTVLWSVLRKAILLTGLGSVIGIPLALSLSRVTASMLFGLSPSDPVYNRRCNSDFAFHGACCRGPSGAAGIPSRSDGRSIRLAVARGEKKLIWRRCQSAPEIVSGIPTPESGNMPAASRVPVAFLRCSFVPSHSDRSSRFHIKLLCHGRGPGTRRPSEPLGS